MRGDVRNYKGLKELIFNHLGGICQHCGADNQLALHHALPLYVGGRNSMSNIELVCLDCHQKLHTELRKIYPHGRPGPTTIIDEPPELTGESLAVLTLYNGGMDAKEIADILNRTEGEVVNIMDNLS